MEPNMIINGLLVYLGLIVLLTFHEFGHAWMALKCGDDTAKQQGRVSLNPLDHIDPIGTVLMPLAMIFLTASGSGLSRFMIGWAKPVPVNPHNLRNPRVDDILVTLAGPWMNIILGIVLMGLARVGMALESSKMTELCVDTSRLSLLLCFFNMLPIPPLDGSQVVRSLVGMSFEAYYAMARYGFIVLILVWQIPFVQMLIGGLTDRTWIIIGGWFGVPIWR
jgi:Zn-dependent protease